MSYITSFVHFRASCFSWQLKYLQIALATKPVTLYRTIIKSQIGLKWFLLASLPAFPFKESRGSSDPRSSGKSRDFQLQTLTSLLPFQGLTKQVVYVSHHRVSGRPSSLSGWCRKNKSISESFNAHFDSVASTTQLGPFNTKKKLLRVKRFSNFGGMHCNPCNTSALFKNSIFATCSQDCSI